MERRTTSLRIGFSWSLAGNIVFSACQWLLIVTLAKLGDPSDVGQYALGLAIATPVTLLANLSLRQVLVSDALELFRTGDYIRVRICSALAASVVTASIAAALYGDRATVVVIALVGLAKASESLSDIIQGFLQRSERMDLVARSLAVRGCLSLGAVAGVFAATRSLPMACAGMAVVSLATVVGYDMRLLKVSEVPGSASTVAALRELRPRNWSIAPFWKLVWTSAPLGFSMMLISLQSNAPRYFVEHAAGKRGLGFFAATTSVMAAGATLVNALGQTLAPRLAAQAARGDARGFSRLVRIALLFSGGLGAAGLAASLVAGPLILRLLFSPDYAPYADVLAWTMAAAAVCYISSILGYAVTALRCFAITPLIYGSGAVAAAALSALLVPRYGLTGASWALLASFAVQVVLIVIFVRPPKETALQVA